MARRVVLALSGGVDSCVSGILLKKAGYEVNGVFVRTWDEVDEGVDCRQSADFALASDVARRLRIPLRQVDFVKEYWLSVFSTLVHEYETGLTPNPDILCNEHIKFGALFDALGDSTHLATGHYASVSADGRLLTAADTFKDQTFFLSRVSQNRLKRTIFPLAGLLKSDVKAIATESGFADVAARKESMGICFIGKRSFPDFITSYIAPIPGNIVCVDTGDIIGKHSGIHRITVGQRTKLTGYKAAVYVAAKRGTDILAAVGNGHPALYSRNITTDIPHWIVDDPLTNCSSATLKFRFQHVHPLCECNVRYNSDGGLSVRLHRPLRALTPGQFGVFYRGNECLGSGKILNNHPNLADEGFSEPITLDTMYR